MFSPKIKLNPASLMGDLDIDVTTDFSPSTIFPEAIRGSMVVQDKLVKHNSGNYFQNIPVDPISHLAAIPFRKAEELGYFKVDFLHLSVLSNFSSKKEIRKLVKTPPDWTLLYERENVEKLFHLHNHFNMVDLTKPTSVLELADCLALIRPNKKDYVYQYVENREATRPKIYRLSGEDKSSFKKSHAIAYATVIVLQLHLIKRGVM